MSDRFSPAFAHRHNPDGSWDSICPRCFFTIATEWAEEKLTFRERDHDCQALIAEKRRAGTMEPLRY